MRVRTYGFPGVLRGLRDLDSQLPTRTDRVEAMSSPCGVSILSAPAVLDLECQALRRALPPGRVGRRDDRAVGACAQRAGRDRELPRAGAQAALDDRLDRLVGGAAPRALARHARLARLVPGHAPLEHDGQR